MTTIYSHSALTPRPFGLSELKAILIEPFLVVGVSVFWIVTLPFTAVSLLVVKVWDIVSGYSRANPLILRRGNAGKSDPAPAQGASAKSVRAHHATIPTALKGKDEGAVQDLSGEPERTRRVVFRHDAERAAQLVAQIRIGDDFGAGQIPLQVGGSELLLETSPVI